MSHETSKALRRRLRDPNFAARYFVGRAIDIGAGPDGLSRQIGIWPRLESVDEWDKEQGDASLLLGVKDNTYDLVFSSHCLEHLPKPAVAMLRWYDVLKPGGHMVIAVPDWKMYEREVWPSRHNPDHKASFVLGRHVSSKVLHNVDELIDFIGGAEAIKIERITEHFDPSLPPDTDQTQGLAECAIEFIVRKPA